MSPYTEGAERQKKEVGGSFNKQENLHTRLVLGSQKTNRSHTHMPESIQRPNLGSVIYITQMISTTPSFLKTIFGIVPTVGTVGTVYSKDRGRVKSLQLLGSSSGVNQWSCLMDDFFQ